MSFQIEHNDEVYTCTLTRSIMRRLEREGFDVNDNKPVSLTYTLFYGSLLTNHPRMTRKTSDKILDDLTTPNAENVVDYEFTEIAEALIELAKPCYSNSEEVKVKKSIMKI